MEDCIFCKICGKEIPAEIVHEDEKAIAFKDIDPQAPVHLLIIPTKHYDGIMNVPAGNDIVAHIHTLAIKLALRFGIADTGFRIVTNCGSQAGQSVNHLHFHLLGGRSFKWPPG
ncbi:MAG: histidine triad nucleotide-binding protein [Eubacteriaceae bacterium]|nr:histidine triad nucleotide-binding protein [Eubacteriaceae bacterium]